MINFDGADLFGAERPLVVSPQHALLLKQDNKEVLVHATHLADAKGGAVRRMLGARSVTQMHLVFDSHQIIFANGRPAESFYPGRRRSGHWTPRHSRSSG